MATTVLVTYATKYGSTREVAEAIAATLSAYGLQTEMRPAWEVRSLDGYSAVVLGAALSRLPVAIFALGPLSTAEKEWQDARAQLDQTLATASWLAPVAVELFGGCNGYLGRPFEK